MPKIVSLSADQLFVLTEECIKKGQSVRVTVKGNSMSPFLRSEVDSVELAAADFNTLNQGDIVLIRRTTGEYILHRVFEKNNNYFSILGDAQTTPEGPIYKEQLLATVTSIWRGDVSIQCSSLVWKTLGIFWINVLTLRKIIGLFRRSGGIFLKMYTAV